MIKSNYAKKNYPTGNILYNNQVGSIIFVCGIVFKVSSLPGLVADSLGSSTLWLFLMMTALDLIMFAAIYFFMRRGTDEILTEKRSKIYYLVNLVTMIFLMVKGVFYFAYSINFLTLNLYSGIPPYIVIIVLLLPIIYIGVKGVRAIGRTAEILTLVIFGLILINLVFLKTEMDFGRNLPILSVEPSEFFKTSLRHGLWLCDLLPLIYVRIQMKKLPHVGIAVVASSALVNIIPMLGIAMFGAALPYVDNMLIRIAGFNQLSDEIGRMEWSMLIVVIVMVIVETALLLWGVSESSKRVFGSKRPGQILFPALLFAVMLAVPAAQTLVDISLGILGYIMLGAAAGLSAALALLAAKYGRGRKRRAEEEALPDPEAMQATEPAVAAETAAKSLLYGGEKEAGNA